MLYNNRFAVAVFVLLGLAVPHAGAAADKQAVVTRIKELGGTYQVDDRLPGKPIVAVQLVRTSLTNEGLSFLDNLTTLRSLDISFSKITSLRALTGLSNLESLTLNYTQISDEGLEGLSRFENLRRLDLSSSQKFTNAGLANLKGLKRLQILNLTSTNVSDGGLGYLNSKALPALAQLNLTDTKITDQGVPAFGEMAQLRILVLQQTQVTNKAIPAFKKFTKLSLLDLVGSKVTWEVIDDLQKALPNTRIFRTAPAENVG